LNVLGEIRAEADLMIARSARGTSKDDGKTAYEWGASVRSVLFGGHPPRKMWIKVAAVALRAIESIDRTMPKGEFRSCVACVEAWPEGAPPHECPRRRVEDQPTIT
jgi:hypothetical protein